MSRCTLIAACDEAGCIGRGGDLPWRLPEDLKHFKRVTMGKPVIMGRKTWDSLYVKPLPGRRNIVVTRNLDFYADGAEATGSIEDALALVDREEEAMVIGGATLFEAALASAQRFHLTEVHAEIEGNIRFPAFDRASWREVTRETHPAADGNPAYSFVLLERA